MRRVAGLVLLMLSFGCAQTPNVTLRVSTTQAARLAPEVRRQLEDGSVAALRDIERDLERGRQRVANAQKSLAATRAEPVIPDAAEVHAAKVVRADRELKWEESLLRAAEWRRASTTSASELAKAQTLSRAGSHIDVSPYQDQQERMRAGLAKALRQQSALRSGFDESERRLTAAKARYATRR